MRVRCKKSLAKLNVQKRGSLCKQHLKVSLPAWHCRSSIPSRMHTQPWHFSFSFRDTHHRKPTLSLSLHWTARLKIFGARFGSMTSTPSWWSLTMRKWTLWVTWGVRRNYAEKKTTFCFLLRMLSSWLDQSLFDPSPLNATILQKETTTFSQKRSALKSYCITINDYNEQKWQSSMKKLSLSAVFLGIIEFSSQRQRNVTQRLW